MSEDLLEKWGISKVIPPEKVAAERERRRPDLPQPLSEFEEEEVPTEEGGYVAFAKNRERLFHATMIEFRLKTGNSLALGYAWLSSIEFDASQGLRLVFHDHRVQIAGRHLRELFQGIVQHRVRWVQEADAPTIKLLAPEAVVVSSITLASGIAVVGYPTDLN